MDTEKILMNVDGILDLSDHGVGREMWFFPRCMLMIHVRDFSNRLHVECEKKREDKDNLRIVSLRH